MFSSRTKTFAHRGLHGAPGAGPENSLAAFAAACDAGYGIELDVRETADGQLAVIHDPTLKRAAGKDLAIADTSYAELASYSLFGSDQHLPLFSEVLSLVNGRVPLIVEIKCDTMRDADRVAAKTARLLDAYSGTYCVESFNPKCLRWFLKHRPQVLRGQLSERFRGMTGALRIYAVPASFCLANFLTRPDFIAYNIRDAHLLRYQVLRRVLHACTVAWTVTDGTSLAEARKLFDVFIFEGFLPENEEQVKDHG